MRFALFLVPVLAAGAGRIPVDVSEVKPGPVTVQATGDLLLVRWPDERSRTWRAEFSLDPAAPLISALGPEGGRLIRRGQPLYWASTGKRRGGWEQFFDFPPSHPEGIRSFIGVFTPRSVRAWTRGDRVEVGFEGLKLGILEGGIHYTFFPGSRLILQEAVVSTAEPDTAFYYDAGLRLASPADERPGRNMDSQVEYIDPHGQPRTASSNASERIPVAVRYRALAARLEGGSLAVFPPPHSYFMPRDYTTNMGNLWHAAWRGFVSLGIRQLPDDNSPYYPWMNAPPGTSQRLGVFLYPGDAAPRTALAEVTRFTNGDRFARLDGFRTLSVHWHFAYTEQATQKGLEWTPPFEPVLKSMGVDASVIMDFHGDGHPRDTGRVRLEELDAFYRACRARSTPDFLLIPGEEPNVHLGWHWAVMFPQPVYWIMSRDDAQAFAAADPKYGRVYRVKNEAEVMEMTRREGGWIYESHPRTKGSTGYPDKILET